MSRPLPPPASDRGRLVRVSALAIALAAAVGVVAQLLGLLIAGITHLAFFGELSVAPVSPADHQLGVLVVLVPVAGALIVGFMARYGSAAIRGHGIPEAMERILFHESRIPPRLTWLKPLSAAIAIGTGGPFGAEGPIIATGGALGSLLGQLLRVTADERKVLLASGAAAGMSATFGAPVSAVLLAVELLLFELRPRSVIPVALATCTANCVRLAWVGSAPVFPMPDLTQPGGAAVAVYVGIGALAGVAAVWATRAVYAIEDAFEHLPVHWMWWPALGGLVVGVVGWLSPRTLGVGYVNIEDILSAKLVGTTMVVFCLLKFVSWSVALGSGTSGGTLAPLFTLGSGLGSAAASAVAMVAPGLGVDPRLGALVGMASIFAGASRAALASAVFAFETTRQPLGLLPLLGGCAAAYLVSLLAMEHSIMTEKIARRGGIVPSEYVADPLSRARVADHASAQPVSLAAGDDLGAVRAWLASGAPGTSHQGFPVVDPDGRLVGVLTQRDLRRGAADGAVRDHVTRAPVVAREDEPLKDAAERMLTNGIGRLAVVRRDQPEVVVGMLTRSDVLAALHRPMREAAHAERGFEATTPPRPTGQGPLTPPAPVPAP